MGLEVVLGLEVYQLGGITVRFGRLEEENLKAQGLQSY